MRKTRHSCAGRLNTRRRKWTDRLCWWTSRRRVAARTEPSLGVCRIASSKRSDSSGSNALAPILDREIDFERLQNSPVKVFITATNVRTGRPRVFRNADITPEVLMASACPPTMFQAVEIDGEPYWDGGYSGNPTLAPLVYDLKSDDTILVPINPVERPGTPKAPREILNRLNEISFNAVLGANAGPHRA
jgi:NTE family protein